MRGTLTSNNSRAIHTFIFTIVVHELCTIASAKRRGALPPVLRPRYLQSPPNVHSTFMLACPRALRAWNMFSEFYCSLVL
ncbi:hypothetical protein K469DRAFT_795018 [Zopfia rhizophila CBS 207.26]|uniref:Uncharacterized protein n=1 Tax=Zopfia rhizophila CBS 207.26 TaxID=1314779 RepID=A0A6A6D8J7_9PEZI|nr:hypothetical protein K469DRAFT_778048 [Zopfia rhizophila CBS 207.26]KAF2192888.1 hypothetical protein K469DRAFT_795018 [Zopfia rhizophila CBS 207.26]